MGGPASGWVWSSRGTVSGRRRGVSATRTALRRLTLQCTGRRAGASTLASRQGRCLVGVAGPQECCGAGSACCAPATRADCCSLGLDCCDDGSPCCGGVDCCALGLVCCYDG